ncbi:MAG: hypothetical protein ACOY90_11250 [Candidatus Zhuqueibacterota bacterium]
MKKYFVFSLLIVALVAMFGMSGCSKNSPTENDQVEETDLDKAYGGFNTSDELPAFGDASIAADFPEDEEVNDPVVEDPEFSATLDSNTVNAYFIRITWGLLEMDSTATTVINWSGTASVNQGVLGVMRAIKFEHNDYVVFPRPDQQNVQWVSYTGPHFDGISLVILDRDSVDTNGEFTFTTGLFSRTFTYAELDSLELVEVVTEQGHTVSIQAYNKQVIPFGGGFLEGRWVKTGPNGGKFDGRWINNIGTHAGHLKGIWGVNRNDEKVFFGKYISLSGQFGGLLVGRWGYNATDTSLGWMQGRWVNRSFTNIGTLQGHWKATAEDGRHGFFHGKWRKLL